jgi:hypothetical protein
MPVLRRGAAGLALATLVVTGLASAGHADNLEVDGDILDAAGAVSLGEVCRGEGADGGVSFDLVRNGSTGPQVWANSAVVTITPGPAAGTASGSLVLGSTSASTPGNWATIGNNATAASGVASVALSVPAAAPVGAASAEVTYFASGPGASAATTTRTDKVIFSWTVKDCAPPSDATPPEIDYTLDPAAPDGLNGWWVSDVALDWTVTDPESDVTTTGCQDETFATDGVHTASCSATSAGGSAGPVTVEVKSDATAPEVGFTGGPADGASYYFGDPIPASSCEATDATSGVTDDGCVVTGGGTTVGTHVQTASAADVAGNTGSAQRSYQVLAWTLDGFYRPVSMGSGTVNTVKAGSTVPLKFNVHKGSTPLTSDIGATFTAKKVGCDGGDAVEPVDEFATTGGTSLRYDAAGGQWVQNWATPAGGKGSCYRVTMTTADGSSISADFKLK